MSLCSCWWVGSAAYQLLPGPGLPTDQSETILRTFITEAEGAQ